ncbi:MAG: hypothetical protein QM621_11300 [Aeromicrobium sp.]|uniref:hypothetical protein n=1 Tax=Aeromicrobium sp. TaxID=1871063 RepID=UPI0039E49486
MSNPGARDAPAAVLSLVGMVALVWFVARCLSRDHPLLGLRLFRSRLFSAGVFAAFSTMFAMMAAFLLIAQWLQLIDDASLIDVGVRLIPTALAGALASVAAPPLARLIGVRSVLAGGWPESACSFRGGGPSTSTWRWCWSRSASSALARSPSSRR